MGKLIVLDSQSYMSEYFADVQPAAPQQDGFFKPPQLQETNDDVLADEANTNNAANDYIKTANDDIEILDWDCYDEPVKPEPALRTWDAFLSRVPSEAQPLLLTEAGASAYDAVLSWTDDPLELSNKDVPAVDAKTYLASLMALALGRESILFLRNEDGTSFTPALPSMRISGFSANVLQGLQKQCSTCGKQLLELRTYVQRTYSKNTSRCSVALASALDEALQAVQQSTVGTGQAYRSLLLLQTTIRGIGSILSPLHALVSELDRQPTDEFIISMAFRYVCQVENSEPWLLEVMQEVLRRVSRPWTEQIEEWIGTRREEGILLTKSDVGMSKGFVKVEAEAYVDDHGEEAEDIDFRLDRSRLPDFMPNDLAQLILETGRNLRFLREAHPEHPLSQPGAVDTNKPPTTEWLYEWDRILELETRVAEYRTTLWDFVENAQARTTSDVARPSQLFGDPKPALEFFVLDERGMGERIMASMSELDAPVKVRAAEGRLARIIRERLSGPQHPTVHCTTRPHYSLIPVLSFGNIVAAQAQVINRETMRELFRSHDLRGHLRLQRNFQLLGNGLFSSRLSHALFDPDLERADRQAGVARQGGVMGLRLGGRDTWPPASSELRLALAGVLTESYKSNLEGTGTPAPISRDASDLPGDLSFAVRDLSEDEIEKCMDPDSLEALDFLRMSYKAPDNLRFVITPMILMHYDRIFMLLVRILRMVFVTDFLWNDAMSCGEEFDCAAYRFVREARHFVSSITSYFFDIGIASPWAAFEERLDKIQTSLDTRHAEQLESPEQLRELHSNVLQAIMAALFLRKRQQPVLKLLEEVFAVILQYAKVARLRRQGSEISGAEDPAQFYRRFKKKVQVFITVCRGLTEKSRAAMKKDDFASGALGDESMIAHLLVKLDINSYYTK